jgi:hypothetical protein
VSACGSFAVARLRCTILDGTGTSAHEISTNGRSDDYGLAVYGPSSKIQIVKPLTKEAISKWNKGGRNWGAWNNATLDQIETIEEYKVDETRIIYNTFYKEKLKVKQKIN